MKSRFSGKRCAVLGVGVSNLPLIRLLCAAGATVEARDKRSPENLAQTAQELRALAVPLRTGDGYLADIRADFVFRSPGIRPDLPEITDAVSHGAALLSEMELFFELCPCPIVGITGSDGKTTTTTLVSLLLKESGRFRAVYLGGNIGEPLLPRLGNMTADDIAVAELSSFQLFTLRRPADVAVITNLSPNHLDWHKGMEEYLDAKKNIYRGEANRAVILNAGNEPTEKIAEALTASHPEKRIRRFSSKRDADLCLKDGFLLRDGDPILPSSAVLLPGLYNLENYMAALAATDEALALAGEQPLSPDLLRRVATTFPGVEHRMEFVREKDGVRYYNSSIDSSPSRTAAALSTFHDRAKLTVLCGGYDKHIPFAPLAQALLAHAGRIILTGATAGAIEEAIAKEIAENAPEPPPEIRRVPLFDDAVRLAASLAVSGDTVLLSPGCASFDAFPNFMARGERFKEIVKGL